MPRGGQNKTSAASKKARGTYRKDRDKDLRPTTPGVVGEPPSTFTKAQRAAWRELEPQVRGVFAPSDHAAFKLLVKLTVMLEESKLPPHVYASMSKSLVGLYGQFGMTPATRSHSSAPPSNEPDEAERFLFGPRAS